MRIVNFLLAVALGSTSAFAQTETAAQEPEPPALSLICGDSNENKAECSLRLIHADALTTTEAEMVCQRLIVQMPLAVTMLPDNNQHHLTIVMQPAEDAAAACADIVQASEAETSTTSSDSSVT